MSKYKRYKTELVYDGKDLGEAMTDEAEQGWSVVQVIHLLGRNHRYRVVYGR